MRILEDSLDQGFIVVDREGPRLLNHKQVLNYQFSVKAWQSLVEVYLIYEFLQVLRVSDRLGLKVKVRS